MTHARCKLWSLVAVMVGPCAVVVSFAPLVHFGTVRGQQRLGVLAKNVLFSTTDTSEKDLVSGFVDSMIETAWDLDAKVEKLVSGLRSSVDVSEEEPISVEEPSSKKSPKPLVDSVIETAWDLDAKVEELVSGLHSSKTPALGDKFPNLVGSTQSTDSFDLYKYLGDNWGVVFMHPSDFTPVCTTELGRAAQLEPEFAKRNAKLCGFSCNDSASHRDWIHDIEAATGAYVGFPIFCDPTRAHAVSLKVLDSSNMGSDKLPSTVRSVYILKPDKTIALMITYPASTGRNFDEILRVLDSLQLTANYSVATPADWTQGKDVIVDFSLSNSEANEKFDSYRVVTVPSEEWKTVDKNYLRYTKDPTSKRKRWWRRLLRK